MTNGTKSGASSKTVQQFPNGLIWCFTLWTTSLLITATSWLTIVRVHTPESEYNGGQICLETATCTSEAPLSCLSKCSMHHPAALWLSYLSDSQLSNNLRNDREDQPESTFWCFGWVLIRFWDARQAKSNTKKKSKVTEQEAAFKRNILKAELHWAITLVSPCRGWRVWALILHPTWK